MTAGIQHFRASTGTNRQRAEQTDAGDTISESLEDKKGSAKTYVNFSEDKLH